MSPLKLPVVKHKKKIDIKKLEKLAKEVRKIFEDEEKSLIEKGQNGTNTSARFLLNY